MEQLKKKTVKAHQFRGTATALLFLSPIVKKDRSALDIWLGQSLAG